MRTKYKLVDLFCGCGGISRGFERTGRFGTQLGIELAPHPAAAFRQNIRNVDGSPPHTVVEDITAITSDTDRLWSELRQSQISEVGEIDVLAGGPPCQGFSRNGVRKYTDDDKTDRFYDDPRNHLYKSFLEFIEGTMPKIVLIENVREFLNFGDGKFSSDLVSRLNEVGYDVDYQKICAADFGVPQIRWRVFFLAVRKDITDKIGKGPDFPKGKFGRRGTQLSLIETDHAYRTVHDAIADLPKPDSTKHLKGIRYENSGYVSELGLSLRNPDGIVYNHFQRNLSKKQIDRINAVGSGRMRDISADLQTKKFYGSAYRRLSWNEPALTITTWVYHVGSGQFAHPVEDRGITMREAARLQTFDDGFIFPPLINPVSQMIGNAVPPLLASAIAEHILTILDEYSSLVNVKNKRVA